MKYLSKTFSILDIPEIILPLTKLDPLYHVHDLFSQEPEKFKSELEKISEELEGKDYRHYNIEYIINQPNKDGKTALMLALEGKDLGAAFVLIRSGANVGQEIFTMICESDEGFRSKAFDMLKEANPRIGLEIDELQSLTNKVNNPEANRLSQEIQRNAIA